LIVICYGIVMADEERLRRKYKLLEPLLNERTMRLCLGADAMSMGRGGISLVAKAAKVSRTTIHAGICDLMGDDKVSSLGQNAGMRVRKPGGGRKSNTEKDAELLRDLDLLLDPVTRGDPTSPLRWTCKSTTKLAAELLKKGHTVSQSTVWRLLDKLRYRMQSNLKTREGSDHPDRNAQFEFIASTVKRFLDRKEPVISVDTKKKELVGEYKNSGKEWEKRGKPVEVNMHDFADPDMGKAIPYGVYDISRNEGWVRVGVTHDTAEFAVETIRRWWCRMGRIVYPGASELLITADGGGSNGSRVRLWKLELQQLANELNIKIHVCHFPPGTSKWNKIEHRMFCHITENWRARPLSSRLAIVNLISNTRTNQGLAIHAELDEDTYETGKKIDDETMNTLAITKGDFHGEWNYSLSPKQVFSG